MVMHEPEDESFLIAASEYLPEMLELKRDMRRGAARDPLIL
jgi:hypothetical protein